MALNDEGHHAYRPAPISEKEAKTVGAEERKEREETTVWVQGLDRINKACGIKFCVDMSATPFYIKGSGYPEGEPLPWIVSDFGLVDAIESGITKIPRLPVSDTTGQPDPKYFCLWRNITKDLSREQRLSNNRPFLLIPYEYEGVQHHYEPDYLVRLKNGRTLIFEIKGEGDDQDLAKHQAAKRWVTAINNWGRLEVWDFAVCRDPALIPKQIAQIGPHY